MVDFIFLILCISEVALASYHEQYRIPHATSDRWESYYFNEKEYIMQNLPVNWENAKIICRGHHNGSLATIDTKDKAEFLAEALSELQFSIESVWVGARRDSADDPEGYRWSNSVELRRTAADVLNNEDQTINFKHYPMWLNRTHIPVNEGGADCVAVERVNHDKPVFLDLPCHLDRPFVCEKDAHIEVRVQELRSVRCRSGLYHVFDGRLDWHQAAAYCVLNKMTLANIATAKCLKKLGLTMLKSRPSIESAWVGAKGALGRWTWIDTGLSIFASTPYIDVRNAVWPPMRHNTIKQNGCLQLDRHATHSPVFMEARCERKMQFICYQATGIAALRSTLPPASDDNFYYILVRQLLYWQHAFENCQRMNGTLATVEHIWISGHLNMTKDPVSDVTAYSWWNPATSKRVPDPKGDFPGLYLTI
ncbi:unnamed protein product, partial [Leptidea sinapis]